MNKHLLCTLAMLTAAALAGAASAAVVYTETFTAGANGWGDRDSGEMAVTHQASVGSPASAAMQGAFSASFLPTDDAFRITSGANFVGDYTTYGDGLTQLRFDLYANSVLPSDVFVRLISGFGTFEYQLNLTSFNTGGWDTFSVNLDWSWGWMGSSDAAFQNALTDVTALEIQITRNGNGAQQFYLDNVQTLDTPIDPPSGAIPEPGTGILVAGALLVFSFRRSILSQAEAIPS